MEAGAHAAEAAPQLVLQSFLARLKPAAESSTPTTASTPAAPSAPPPSAPSAGAHEGRPPEPRGEAATPARRSDLAAADAGGTTAAPPAEKVSSEEIEHEFDQLLEALSSGNAPGAPSGEPLCISCDKPVQLPYVSCQGCGNPLCAECRAAAAEEGHPRRCPTCALLQKYSQ